MGRRSRDRGARAPELPTGPQRIDTGTAEFVRDPDRDTGWMLLVNGAESSHADLADPAWLEFEYLRWMAQVIEHHFPAGSTPDVLHLGAAGCSLARHLLVTRPGSRHLGVDIDAALTELVRRWFDLPRAPSLKIRVGDARTELATLPDRSRDVIVRDVFAGRETPDELLTVEFVQEVARVLRPGGLYLANCADGPDLRLARTDAAALAAVFDAVTAVADPPMLKGRRRGNVVLVAAATEPGDERGTAALERSLRGDALPAQYWGPGTVRSFIGTVRPRRDPVPDDPDTASHPADVATTNEGVPTGPDGAATRSDRRPGWVLDIPVRSSRPVQDPTPEP